MTHMTNRLLVSTVTPLLMCDTCPKETKVLKCDTSSLLPPQTSLAARASCSCCALAMLPPLACRRALVAAVAAAITLPRSQAGAEYDDGSLRRLQQQLYAPLPEVQPFTSQVCVYARTRDASGPGHSCQRTLLRSITAGT